MHALDCLLEVRRQPSSILPWRAYHLQEDHTVVRLDYPTPQSTHPLLFSVPPWPLLVCQRVPDFNLRNREFGMGTFWTSPFAEF